MTYMNKYSKSFNLSKTFYPNLFSFINAIPDKWIYSAQYQPVLKHPGSVLSKSTEEIVISFNIAISKFDKLLVCNSSQEQDAISKELIKEMEILIGHFDSFYDECYLILKSLCPTPRPDKAPGEKYVGEWLKRNDYNCSANFFNCSNSIRLFIDLFSNRLKHANQYLNFVKAENKDKVVIPGFFIEELKGNDVMGIYQIVPSDREGCSMAFSFNQMFRMFLLFFYEICDSLETVIKKHIYEVQGEHFSGRKIVKHSEEYLKIIEYIVNLPYLFYPYEYKKFLKMYLTGNTLVISYPHNSGLPYMLPLTVSTQYRADGYTKTFALPIIG
jgi:hypothetical protein